MSNSNLISLGEVPQGEIRLERPERAMANSAARAQINLNVSGAKKEEGTWNAVLSYQYSPGDNRDVETMMKKTLHGDYFVTLGFYHENRGTFYRDIYLT